MSSQWDVHRDFSPESGNMRSGEFPMRVTLIPQSGYIRSVWLPKLADGRYRFLNRHGVDDGLPFYIEAKDGIWVANSGRSASFVKTNRGTGEELVMGQELPLDDAVMGNLHYNGEKYILYAEVERPNDYAFLPYYFEDRTDYTIGRQEDNLICYPNLLISRRHAILHWKDGLWEIIDQDSANGVYVNGKRVKQASLRVGDHVFMMGLHILAGSGFLSINNANGRVMMNTPKIRRITDRRDVYYPDTPAVEKTELFDRQPRKLNKVDPAPIEIDMPPMPLSANKIPLLLRMGNPLLMGGQALMTGNIFMAMTSMVLPSMTQGMTEKDRKEYEAKRLERYRAYLVEKREEIRREKEAEERQLAYNHSDLNQAAGYAQSRERLWERRKVDSDFLDVRIGHGQIPMLAKRAFQPRKFQLEEDILLREMYDLAEQPVVLENAPVLLSLTQDYIVGILGERCACVELLRGMVMQIAVAHSYDEVKLVLLAEREDLTGLNFVRYLPHCWSNDRSIRFFASSQADAQQLSKYLSQEFQTMLDSGQKNDCRKKAAYIVMVLSRKLFDCVEILKDVLDQENYCGVSVLAALESLPKECSKIVDLRGQNRIIDLNHCDLDDQLFSMDTCEPDALQLGLRQLMQTKLKLDCELYALPPVVTFLELYHAGRVEHLNPLKRWADNDPVQSLAAPVGIGTDGGLFTLDLHEKRQGPHGLVAGMTGSGKSEFIITYILSMAVNYSPDEVAFILIDYKGGGLADAFEDEKRGIHLPHLAGTITNLDGASIQRSLMSIKSELNRRQAIFKKVKSETNEGTLDIYDYQRLYRDKKIAEPLPHLFIISDEFAELKKQQPEFMDELISAARIGRSLGVHLILATQKPSGVVNDQIWSNTKFRVCLRVQDRGDSMEMLKRPEAAELKNTGRFYLQVGYNEFFAMGQSAWCGAGYTPQEEVQAEGDHSVEFIDNIGQTVLEAKVHENKAKAESKQIVAVVQYLSDLARQEGIRPKNLWLPPLPDRLELRTLMERFLKPEDRGIRALLGMVDDPERQEQFPLFLDMQSFHSMLVCGSGGSGKSTLVGTLLYTLVETCSPAELNYYILDLSGGVLSPFAAMPHCSAYLTEQQENDFDRLLALIQDMTVQRKRLFAEADVFSFEAYRQVRDMPLVLVILDGFTNIQTFQRGTEYYNSIHEYMRDAANCGIRFLLSCNHLNEVSAKARQEIDYGLALQAKDKYEYGDILGIKCQLTPPVKRGRGICAAGTRPLEYHVAIPDCDADGQTRTALLKQSLNQTAARYAGVEPARKLPMADSEQEYTSFCADIPPERIPLGYSVQTMKKVAIPLQQLSSMSLYFGNPLGIRPVLCNLVEAARRDQMDLVVMRRNMDTLFDSALEQSIRLSHSGRFTLLDTTAEDLARLDDLIIEEIKDRNVFRDIYSEQNGIPQTDKGRAKKAGRFIRAHSRPLLVLFESFGDLCRLEKSEALTGEYAAFFTSLKGYNIYFCGCFYPDEEGRLGGHPLMESFHRDELLLLFGGRYDRQCITNLPMELRSFEKINPKYDRFMLKYQGSYYPMIMPCGKLNAGEIDPDEAPII